MELSDDIRNFLAEKRFPVLATIGADGLPQQSVMWYVLDGDEILMNTKRGRIKDGNLKRDPRVSLCFEDEYNWMTLVGEVRLIEDQEQAQADIRRLAIRYHGESKGQRMAEEQFEREERISLRMKITRVVNHAV